MMKRLDPASRALWIHHIRQGIEKVNQGLSIHEARACFRDFPQAETFICSPLGVNFGDSAYSPGIRWFLSGLVVYIEYGLYSSRGEKLVACATEWSIAQATLTGEEMVTNLRVAQPKNICCFLQECQPFFDSVCCMTRDAPQLKLV